MYENGAKRLVNRTYWLKKRQKKDFFTLKYWTKYTPETFFEENINVEIFLKLRCGGVIPVQSFGSHIRPQLPGLGLFSAPKWAEQTRLLQYVTSDLELYKYCSAT